MKLAWSSANNFVFLYDPDQHTHLTYHLSVSVTSKMASATRGKSDLMVPNEGLLADTRTRVFEFNPFRIESQREERDPEAIELEKGNDRGHPYAPEPADPSEMAYYLEVSSTDWNLLFQEKARKTGTTIFVSVSLVKDILEGQNREWTQGCSQVASQPGKDDHH